MKVIPTARLILSASAAVLLGAGEFTTQARTVVDTKAITGRLLDTSDKEWNSFPFTKELLYHGEAATNRVLSASCVRIDDQDECNSNQSCNWCKFGSQYSCKSASMVSMAPEGFYDECDKEVLAEEEESPSFTLAEEEESSFSPLAEEEESSFPPLAEEEESSFFPFAEAEGSSFFPLPGIIIIWGVFFMCIGCGMNYYIYKVASFGSDDFWYELPDDPVYSGPNQDKMIPLPYLEERMKRMCCIGWSIPKVRGLPTSVVRLPSKEKEGLLVRLAGNWKIQKLEEKGQGKSLGLQFCMDPTGLIPCLTGRILRFDADRINTYEDFFIDGDRIIMSGGRHDAYLGQGSKRRLVSRANQDRVARVVPFRDTDGTLYLDQIGSEVVRISADLGELEVHHAFGVKFLLQREWKRRQGHPGPQTPPMNNTESLSSDPSKATHHSANSISISIPIDGDCCEEISNANSAEV